MSRIPFRKTNCFFVFVLITTVLFIGEQAALLAQSDSSDRPNIIVLLTDQQSASMMSVTGNESLDTPEMDRLARNGVRFERAYVTNPVCYPARFSLMTGRMPSDAGIRYNGDPIREEAEPFQRHSLGTLFSRNGYNAVYGGKFHLPGELHPERNGFRVLTRNDRGKLAKQAAEFIKQDHENPFLLFTSFIQPHDICYMAINAYRRSQGKGPRGARASQIVQNLLEPMREKGEKFIENHTPPLPPNYAIPDREPDAVQKGYVERRPFRNFARKKWTEREWRLHRWLYARLTERLDRQIGTVMDAVREAGIGENTFIVLTSEHGDMDAAHRLEHKTIPYEEAARVPMVVRWKNHIEGGRVDDTHLISNGLDLLPTLCDYAGIPAPDHLRGRSLRPLLEGEDVDWRDQLVVESRLARMLRTDRYKYVVYERGDLREQLTDLQTDPGELQNLAGDPQYRSQLNELRARLQRWVEQTNDNRASEYVIPPE